MTIRLPVLTVFLLLFVAGCAVEPVSTPEQQPTTIQGLLSGAADTNDASLRRQYQLKAAQMLQTDGEYATARSLLDAMDPEQIEDELRDRYLWLSSRDAVERGDTDAASRLADQLDPELPLRLPPEQRASAFESVAGAYELAERHLPNARTLILWSGSEARPPAALNQRIWGALREVPRAELEPVAERSSDYRERGWLELALALAAHDQHEVEARSQAIQNWKKVWPDHSAAEPFPGELALLRRQEKRAILAHVERGAAALEGSEALPKCHSGLGLVILQSSVGQNKIAALPTAFHVSHRGAQPAALVPARVLLKPAFHRAGASGRGAGCAVVVCFHRRNL